MCDYMCVISALHFLIFVYLKAVLPTTNSRYLVLKYVFEYIYNDTFCLEKSTCP